MNHSDLMRQNCSAHRDLIMDKQRIGCIDTMRGFTMLLVVYYHVVLYAFRKTGASWDVNNFFVTFRMPLFFFLSGFLMYKPDLFKSHGAVSRFLRKKGMVQLFPTLVFSLLFVLIHKSSYSALLLDRFKYGYWFTYTLFFYFLIYAIGDYAIGRILCGRMKIVTGLVVATLIYAVAKYSVTPSCSWGESVFCRFIGIANFQYFIFFFFGALIRSYYAYIDRWLQRDAVVTSVFIGFVVIQLLLQLPECRGWMNGQSHIAYSLLQSFSGFWGIAAVFVFFRKNEYLMRNRVGRFFRYIGVRTLDIYLIHFLLVYTDMHYVGAFLARHDSLIAELVLGMGVSLIIIAICLLVSRFLRSSDTLAKLLFGKVIKDDEGV